MAFADPQPITINAVVKNLPRIDMGKATSEYNLVEATQSFNLFIRSQDLKVEADGRRQVRHNITLTHTIFATTTVPQLIRKCSTSIQHYVGDDPAAYDDVGIAVSAMVTAANVVKLNNYES